ncbi:MAG: RNA polymerase sigma factor WhiG [Actinobacteria bacterium]|nr:RNA polymerase sigma factor WhiG [Actinomycetota bacterium]
MSDATVAERRATRSGGRRGSNATSDSRQGRPVDPEVREQWERYRDGGEPGVREKLILQYAPLVKYVAGRVGVGLPSSIEHGDLVSYGMFGLIDAIERFDLEKGVKFETYAITRIRGAIIDELRSVDWVPRSVRSKARTIDKAMQHLEGKLKRTPTDEELAAEVGVSLTVLEDMLEKVSFTSVVALDEALNVGGEDGGRVALVDTLQDLTSVGPEENVDDVETKRLLVEAIERLSEREQKVIAFYYFEGLTLAQIGGILGVTESRICQIHTKAVLSLRSKMLERSNG